MTRNNAINNTLEWLKLRSGNFWLRLRAPTLTANRDVTIGPTGLASIAATTQAEGRTAIDAASPGYVQSRGQNLVTNGSGLLRTNYNFSALTFDSTETYSGGGSFRYTGLYTGPIYSDELIPVDPSRAYLLSVFAKCGNANGTGFDAASGQYIGISTHDVDGLDVGPQHYAIWSGSALTTLAAPVNPGATTITLTSASGWNNGGYAYERHIRWYGYQNAGGFTYPNYTYSRNGSYNQPNYVNKTTWNAGGISGNVITLAAPWDGPALPAGTAVSNAVFGGSFKYIAAVSANTPNAWTQYTGAIQGVDVALSQDTNKFPPGTAFIKVLLLPNLATASASTVVRYSNISFSDAVAESMPAGNFPNLMGFGQNPSSRTTIGPGTAILTGVTTEATTTTTGAFQLPGIGMGNGRGVFNVGTAYNNSTAAVQQNRSLYFADGNPVFRLGDGRDITPIPVALAAPTDTTITVPYNATATTFASRNAAAGLTFNPAAANTRTAGTVTAYSIVADGVNVPTVSAPIQRVAGSLSYDNRNGVVNTFQFTWDGTSLWYQILRAEIPPLTGLTTIATTFSVINGNFTNPSTNAYGSLSTTPFSGSGGSAQSIPAGKDGQITALVGPTTIVGLHNNNTTAAVAGTTQTWLYYVWNANGTLYTAEGATTQASSVTGVTGNRYVQIRRVGSTVSIHHRVLLTDAWTLVRTMPTANAGQLFVMLGTTSPNTAQIISLEVAA